MVSPRIASDKDIFVVFERIKTSRDEPLMVWRGVMTSASNMLRHLCQNTYPPYQDSDRQAYEKFIRPYTKAPTAA